MNEKEEATLEIIKLDVREIKVKLGQIEEDLKSSQRISQYQSGFGASIACMSAGMAVIATTNNVVVGLSIFLIGIIIGISSYVRFIQRAKPKLDKS
jgi:uncharacterized membrane protein SpoIIM required for sporulation